MRPATIAKVSCLAVIATLSYFVLYEYKQTKNIQPERSIVQKPIVKLVPDSVIAPKERVAVNDSIIVFDNTSNEHVASTNPVTKNKFIYNNLTGSTYNAAQGTTIYFPDHAFIDEETGEPVNTPVDIQVKEYYAMDEIFLNDLHTMSDSGLLETNGMINVRVSTGNRPCKLANGKTVFVSFPMVNNKPGMELFIKDQKDINDVWHSVKFTNTSVVVAPAGNPLDKQMAEGNIVPKLTNGVSSLKNYIDKSVRPGYSRWSGIMQVEFVVTENGYTTEIKVLKEINKDATAQIGIAMSNLRWQKGFRNNLPARYRATIAFQYKSFAQGVYNMGLVKPFEYAPYIRQTATRTDNFAVSQLGWINCDRFVLFSKRTDLMITDSSEAYANVKIIFHNYKSILPAIHTLNEFGFKNIPADEPITVVAVKKKGNKYAVSVQQTNTSVGSVATFKYRLVSKDEFRNIILGLDKASGPTSNNTTAMR